MGSCDDAKALAEGQRAARSAIPEWDRATTQKLWPKANAQLGARSQTGIVRRRKRIRRIRPLDAYQLGGVVPLGLLVYGEDRALVAGKIGERSKRHSLNRFRVG